MSEKNEHFMVKCKGPAKQFLALVGDDNGMIRQQLNERSQAVDGENDCYFIETYYYSAKYGIKTFSTPSQVSSGIGSSQIMCLFLVYKSMGQLKEAKEIADKIKADMRVVIIESSEVCPEADQVETFASGNEFEIVYLNPNEQQLADAEELAEKVGIERLLETMEVCNWPWRVVNAFAKGTLTTFMTDGTNDHTEHKIGEDDVIAGPAADLLMRNYVEWFTHHPDARIPAPQHAERVHLSPDSPTTTEGTTNPDDVSISVDIDLVCTKSQEENEDQRTEENAIEKNTKKAASPKNEKKEKKS